MERSIVLQPPQPLVLDYGQAATSDLLGNLSSIVMAQDRLWSASDEGRTLECLEPSSDGFTLRTQIELEHIFPDLPAGEADLEAIDFDGRALWLCGSHCRVRRKPLAPGTLNPEIGARPSRHLFARLPLNKAGEVVSGKAEALPFKGRGSLRRLLGEKEHLAPFIELPSKEGGLDIEGLAITPTGALFGLRGPVVDSMAVVAEVSLAGGQMKPGDAALHFIDLQGLGVRELTRFGDDILIVSGPTADIFDPFRISRWRPTPGPAIQHVEVLYEWPAGREKPEGLCRLQRGDRDGLLVVYDSPTTARISGSRYAADWFPISR